MRLDGVHHVTCITGDAPRNVDFYTRVARAPARQEDRQPGRPDRLPPLLRRRGGQPGERHHLLRVPRRGAAAQARAWCTRSGGDVGSEEARSTSGSGGSRPRERAVTRGDGGLTFEDPEGLAHELAGGRDAATRRSSPSIRRSRRSSRSRASTAFARTPRDPSAVAPSLEDALGFEPPRRQTLGGARRGARRALRLRRAAAERGLGGAGTVHHVAWASTMEEHATWHERVTDCGPPPDADHRPLLVPLDLLPRAERRPLRDRDPRARASQWTRIPSTSASALVLPPAFEHLRAADRADPDAAAGPAGGRRVEAGECRVRETSRLPKTLPLVRFADRPLRGLSPSPGHSRTGRSRRLFPWSASRTGGCRRLARHLHNIRTGPRPAGRKLTAVRQRIAVIEDEATIAAAVAARLRAEGFEVEIAGDGLGGVALCQRRPAGPRRPRPHAPGPRRARGVPADPA